MSGPLKRLRLENHKGIINFTVAPDGKSLRLEGANGAGKSSVIDGIEWIVSDDGSDGTMRNGAGIRYGEMVFGEYLITRRQKRGGKPTRNVAAAQLAEVRAALSRKTFSSLPESEQVATLKRLAPGLDVSALEVQEKRAYDERTIINRDAKTLRAQAEGVVVPAAPAEIGEELSVVDVVDVAVIAAKKGDVERVKAENARLRGDATTLARTAANARAEVGRLQEQLAQLQRDVVAAQSRHEAIEADAKAAAESAVAIVDPDTSAIDAEIATARQQNATARAEAEDHNRKVRAAQAAAAEAKRAAAERARLEQQAAAKESEARALTERMEALASQRLAAIAAAKLPITGLCIMDGRAMFDDGKSGPVPISDGEDTPNAGERMRINIAVHAALGHKIVAVRNASLMDEDTRAAAEALANEHGIQLISEIVRRGAPLTAVIEDDNAPVQGEIGWE